MIFLCKRVFRPFIILLCLFLPSVISSSRASAQTMVSGNISGTWDLKGSPYIVVDNCTVPNGQVLTIKPGVTVVIGDSLGIVVNGQIIAVGSKENHIIVKSPNESIYWDTIRINSINSKFIYCDFSNAKKAFSLYIGGQWSGTLNFEINNCTISNCTECGIYGETSPVSEWNRSYSQYLNPTIEKCSFNNTVSGCYFYIHGYIQQSGFIPGSGGYSFARINNCIFKNLSDTALKYSTAKDAGTSQPLFYNNIIINSKTGVFVQYPMDAEIKNNIFYKTSVGIKRSGSSNSKVSYNCFFDSDSTFVNYPDALGQISQKNSNGTPSDIAYNIFADPLFSNTTDYQLSDESPCIDAGDPGFAFNDVSFPPSKGTKVNDMGAYGGLGASSEKLIFFSTPEGGEVWRAESTHEIAWSYTNIETMRLEYSTDGGETWLQIATGINAVSRNYNWKIPAKDSKKCLLKISDISDASVYKVSEVFTIEPIPYLEITSPNGGEKWYSESIHDITWSYINVDSVNLEYSTDGDTKWIEIANNIQASLKKYSFTLPKLESTKYNTPQKLDSGIRWKNLA